MSKYLKALGLAMVAAFAFSAMTAAGASAQTQGHLTTDGERVTLKGTENAEGTNAFTAFGSEVQCPGSTYTGHKVGVTDPKVPLTHGDTESTITPHYINCESGGSARTVDMNSCDYEFSDFTTTGGVEGTYGLTAAVECDVDGDAIEVTGTAFCPVKVPEQTGLTGLHATNLAGGKVRIHGTIHNVTATHCFAGHTATAQQHQDVTVEGLDSLGDTTAISISD